MRTLTSKDLLFGFGMLGQICFSARFIIQWIFSEKKKKSVIPVSFWYFSLIGGVILLIYAILRKEPVFILGQAPGIFIYSRNIYMIRKRDRKLKERRMKIESRNSDRI